MKKSQEENRIFLNSVFEKLLHKYSQNKLASILNKSRQQIYSYKHALTNSISYKTLIIIQSILKLEEKIIKDNTLETFSKKEFNKKNVLNALKKRKDYFQEKKENIPLLNEILNNNFINCEKWLDSHIELINLGFRKIIEINKQEEIIQIRYSNFSNGIKKEFCVNFPRKIIIDEDFLYFFGLFTGDKSGTGRIGIINKNKKILDFTKTYLKRIYQEPSVILYLDNKCNKLITQNYDKKIIIKNNKKGYAFSVHKINGILKSFFNYLIKNLDLLLNSIDQKNIFFAGLFDAEGNVSLEDSCFRWACKNTKQVKIYKKYLKKLNLYKRYDGSNLITYNKIVFQKQILPYLKHSQKINDSMLVCFKNGKLNLRFLGILKTVYQNNGSTNKELA